MPQPTEPAPATGWKRLLVELFYGYFPNKPAFTPKDYPDLTGKIAIVTGSNTGIGLATVKLLYSKNCNVIMVVRNKAKGVAARDQVIKENPDPKGELHVVGGCDFCDLTLIKGAAQEIKQIVNDRPCNIIIHNAGLMSSNSTLTSKQGYELIFQTNVVGPQLLQHFLDPLFLKKDSDLKRIVWVTAGAAIVGPKEYGIFWEHPAFENVPVEERPNGLILYAQSKAANMFQASAWAAKNKERVNEIGCLSTSCYPGIVESDLQREWTWKQNYTLGWFLKETKLAAYCELYGALSPDLTIKDQGACIYPFGEIRLPREDMTVGMKNGTDLALWDYVEGLNEPYF